MKISPRQLEKMAKRMGIQSTQIDAEEVIIKTRESRIIIRNPQVAKVNMMGQETFQISGDVQERTHEEYTAEDVSMVVNQTGCSEEEAEEALKQAHGDLAEAIMKVKENKA